MGELSPKVTEGEKPHKSLHQRSFSALNLWAEKRRLIAPILAIAVETGFAGSTSRRESFRFVRRAAETRYAGFRCVKHNQQRGSSWVQAQPAQAEPR